MTAASVPAASAVAMPPASTGRLELRAARRGNRTIVERVRYDGVSRCSRTFYGDDGSATVMLSQLGPGVVRGDRIEVVGSVGEGAHLIVTEQSATRVLGGERSSAYTAAWTVEAGATLELHSEPVLALTGSDHRLATRIVASGDATVVVRDIVHVAVGARLRLRTSITNDGLETYYDGVNGEGNASLVFGTLVVIGRAFDGVAAFGARIEAIALPSMLGIGVLPNGIYARCTGDGVWAVREALATLANRIPTIHGMTRVRSSAVAEWTSRIPVTPLIGPFAVRITQR